MAEDWSAEDIAELTRLWADETLSTGAIAKRMGRSKNSIVGKAHRQRLPARESPIGRVGPRHGTTAEAYARPQAQNAARGRARTAQVPGPIPPRESEEEAARRLRDHQARVAELAAQVRGEAERRAHRPPAPSDRGPLHYGANMPCQWPSGDAPIRFACTAPRVPDRPYCHAHCARAYVFLRPAVAA